MSLLLSDVNLTEILFKSDQGVELKFLDMCRGNIAGIVTCSQLFAFKYESIMELTHGSFPKYVGEVNLSKLSNITKSDLQERGFSFRDINENLLSQEIETVFELHVEGGEVLIEVLAGDIQFKSK